LSSSSSAASQAEQKFILLLASYVKELNLLWQELEKGEFLKPGAVKGARSAIQQAEKSPFLIRGLSVPNVMAQAFLGLAPPAEIKVFTPPITKANQPQTFNMPNGTVLWLIIDNNLPTQLDQISVSFDAGQSYKTIPKGSTFNLSPFSIPFSVRRLYFQSPTANAPFELMLAVI
jgi:hypothetical protein